MTITWVGPLTRGFTGEIAPDRTKAQGTIRTKAQQSRPEATSAQSHTGVEQSRDLDNESDDELSQEEPGARDQGMRDFDDGLSQEYDPLSTIPREDWVKHENEDLQASPPENRDPPSVTRDKDDDKYT